jgi:urease accessory protein UreH
VLLTQQSASKVHPGAQKCAIQRNSIHVEAGGELHLYMEPLIPFAGSRLNQATAINVESGGRVYFWESFMAGRIGSGESWQFDELAAETSIRVNGQLLYIDRFQLTPQKRPLAGTWILDDARYVGSGLCVDERSSNLAGLLHDLMPAAGTDSPAAGLTIVRVTETDGPAFHAQRDAFMRGCLCGKL